MNTFFALQTLRYGYALFNLALSVLDHSFGFVADSAFAWHSGERTLLFWLWLENVISTLNEDETLLFPQFMSNILSAYAVHWNVAGKCLCRSSICFRSERLVDTWESLSMEKVIVRCASFSKCRGSPRKPIVFTKYILSHCAHQLYYLSIPPSSIQCYCEIRRCFRPTNYTWFTSVGCRNLISNVSQVYLILLGRCCWPNCWNKIFRRWCKVKERAWGAEGRIRKRNCSNWAGGSRPEQWLPYPWRWSRCAPQTQSKNDLHGYCIRFSVLVRGLRHLPNSLLSLSFICMVAHSHIIGYN